MKTSLRKLVAMICVLAIAAVLPVMASAAGTTVTLTASAETVKAGESFTVTVNIADNEGWDLFDSVITYDEGITPVPSYSEEDEDYYDAIEGPALGKGMASVTLDAPEGILAAAISANTVKKNGELLTITFDVADDAVAGTTFEIAMTIKAFSESIIEDGQNVGATDRVAPNTVVTATVAVADETVPTESTAAPTESTAAPTESTAAPTESTAAPTESTAAPTESTAAPTESTAAPTESTVAPTEVEPTETEPTETEPTETEPTDAPIEGPVTGEAATMIVLALVLLAGSAVLMVSLKKKAESK